MELVEFRVFEKKRELFFKDWVIVGIKGKRKFNVINFLYLELEVLEDYCWYL